MAFGEGLIEELSFHGLDSSSHPGSGNAKCFGKVISLFFSECEHTIMVILNFNFKKNVKTQFLVFRY